MKKSAKADLRSKGPEELAAQTQELRETLLKARVATAVEGKAKSIQYRNARRQIARIATIQGEKRAAEQKAK